MRRTFEGKQAVRKDDGIHIDLHQLGYNKLLGNGRITHHLIIKVASRSKAYAEKS